jgi:hypothetical protein
MHDPKQIAELLINEPKKNLIFILIALESSIPMRHIVNDIKAELEKLRTARVQ